MVDIIDKTQDEMDLLFNHQISNRQKFEGESLKYCLECDTPIPLERQKLGGVKLCVDCQESLENKRR